MSSMTQQKSSLDNYKAMLDERAELHMSKKRIEEKIKELDEALKPALADKGPLIYNGYQHEVKSVAGRKSVDYKQMAEDYGIDLEDYTKVGAPSMRYEIKRVNEL